MWPSYPPDVQDPQVLPLVGLMTSDRGLAPLVLEALKPTLGPCGIESEPVPFTYTDYYEVEMGTDLVRWYAAFAELMPASFLPELKHRCARLEAGSAVEGRRRINLDPGYLDLTKVVLASWKAGNYKIYLRDGVWADPVLMFENGRFRTQPWTFPDMRAGVNLSFFETARQLYKKLLRGQNPACGPGGHDPTG